MIDPYAAGRLDEAIGLPWRRLDPNDLAPADVFDRLEPERMHDVSTGYGTCCDCGGEHCCCMCPLADDDA